MESSLSIKKEKSTYKVHPKKFALWLLLVGITMLFAGFTSAYIVRRAEGNWMEFALPSSFLYSTVVVLLSSLSMWWAMRSAKRDEITQTKTGLWATLALGVLFGVLQYMAWTDMVQQELFFSNLQGNKISASFVYVISGMHLLHILGGLIYMVAVLFKTYQFKVHKKSLLSIDLCNTYWHFVGLLWVYLYLFLYFARNISQ
jgi:cytochrome c oxidase subunit 3